jgi:very-short-patch-repair endonuclease
MRGPQPWKTNRARVLRAQPISAQERVWSQLRNRNLNGWKFARQVPIDRYFVDFVCRERKIIVEVDGGTHATDDEVARDTLRTAKLESLGYRLFRVRNDEVYGNIEGVLDTLVAFIDGKLD